MADQERLAKWVAEKHKGQLIKKTSLPYYTHLLNVANTSKPFEAFGFEIGLCHDLLEDTETTIDGLLNALIGFGYSEGHANLIAKCVQELTDVYSKSDFPVFSKRERRKREARRLVTISPAAQTVKYADIIDNIAWVLQYEKKKAEKYLKRKRKLLENLDKGNSKLKAQALELVLNSLNSLKD